MKLRLAILAAFVLGLGVPSIAVAGEVAPPPCNPHHEQCGPPSPHGGPTCEDGGTVVWINQYHYVCVVPPGDGCIYERSFYGR